MSASVTITVPCVPDRCSSPNARCHWAQVRACSKRLRECAGWAAREAAGGWGLGADYLVDDWLDLGCVMDLDIRWPVGARIKDSDNAIAMCKNLRDGIADALFAGEDKHIRQGSVTQAVTGEGITVVTLRAAEPE